LHQKNISVVVAAGNDNDDVSKVNPANCLYAIPVAATSPSRHGAYYSNYGASIPFAAPGGDDNGGLSDEIYSTIENTYGYKEGTSMAAPHVAGMSVLMYSLDPTLTPESVTDILQKTATKFADGGSGKSCVPEKPCG